MPRILDVEDDLMISDFIAMNLQVAGYECTQAFDGLEAFHAIQNQVYDLALLDVMLSEIDGFALIGFARERGIPVIFVSARTNAEDRIKGLKLGAGDYIIKPFDIMELLVRIEKVLECTYIRRSVYTLLGVTIDEESHTVTVHGTPVEMKPMAFVLMTMLAKHQGMAFSREQLLHEVWGDDYFGETRTVDVHIAALRKKLNWTDAIQPYTVLVIG